MYRPLLLIASLVLAGCATTSDPPAEVEEEHWTPFKVPEVPSYDFRNAFDIVHPHDVRELHTESYGLELIGYSSLADGVPPYVVEGGYIEVDVHGDLAVVATLTGTRAFTLVDISDLTSPQVLSHFYSSNDNWDVRFTEDGSKLFVSCQGEGLYTRSPIGQCSDYTPIPTATGDEDYGIITVDITDPSDPQPLCYTQSKAVHNLHTMDLADGRTLVANNNAEIFVMLEDGCLEKTAEVPGRHDVFMQHHPVTGQPLLYTGHGDLMIYDISDPYLPEILGVADLLGQPGATGWHEQSPAPNTWYNGTHVTFGAGERSSGRPGPVSVIDTTDPQNAVLKGMWILPVPALDEDGATYEQDAYMFSEHNIEVNQWGQACIGHYHGGVWVIDVSTPERMREPVTLGFYLPHNLAPESIAPFHPLAGPMTASPYVWGCAWTDDGMHLLVPDMMSGLYILEPDWFELQE